MTTFAKGDRVKLKHNVSVGLTRRSSGGKKVDWTKRVGTFVRSGVHGTAAHIAWPGNQAPDIWPIGALVKVKQ